MHTLLLLLLLLLLFFTPTVAVVVVVVVVLLLRLYQSTYNHRSVSHSLFRNFKPHIDLVCAFCGTQSISMNRERLLNTMMEDKDTEG